MVRAASVATAIAWVGPVFVIVALLGLTIRQHAFLDRVGWDPIGRTQTQWPSLMAIGPDGWVLTVAFAAAAFSALGLAVSLALTSATPTETALSALCAVLAIGLTCVAFSADLPGQPRSWHAFVHNTGYPLIPLTILSGAFLTSRTSAHRATWPSRVIFCVIAIAFALTGVDPVAQLSRYFLFGALLCWVLLVVGTQHLRLDRQRSTSARIPG